MLPAMVGFRVFFVGTALPLPRMIGSWLSHQYGHREVRPAKVEDQVRSSTCHPAGMVPTAAAANRQIPSVTFVRPTDSLTAEGRGAHSSLTPSV
ncbi:MAG TPA: hypothetical protein DCY59_08695 [Micrococcaceae bacterium]|nr:hypothetical protein [Micrococcaceae bacterium]